jgi:hypothetical protein
MKPAREQLPADAIWQQIVVKCFDMGIDLQAKSWSETFCCKPGQTDRQMNWQFII